MWIVWILIWNMCILQKKKQDNELQINVDA